MDLSQNTIFVKTLKDQVYEYLKDQIQAGRLLPGSSINMEKISKQLGISITPLRDALIKLEVEGFVNIFPRKGIKVNHLSLEDIKASYTIIGALEAAALIDFISQQTKVDLTPLKNFSDKMKIGLKNNDFEKYYSNNLSFHNYYIKGANNEDLLNIIEIKRRRLYDFQRKKNMLKEWEKSSIKEHQKIISYLEEGKYNKAAEYIRDVHWSFKVQKKYIKKYYKFTE